jgi:hypothetical protein
MQLISTMATPLLVYGATAVFECIDASTDLPVTGVKIINPVIAGVNLSGDANAAPAVPAGPFMLVPGPAA